MIACSKKCKKVAKFSYMLKKNNENDILKTFESMLRKKMQKNIEHASRGIVSKSIVGIYGNSSFEAQVNQQPAYKKNYTVRASKMNVILGTDAKIEEAKGGIDNA